jgi:hypothetical protein
MSTTIDAAPTIDAELASKPGVNLVVDNDIGTGLQAVRGPEATQVSALSLATGGAAVGSDAVPATFRVVAPAETPPPSYASIEFAGQPGDGVKRRIGVGNAKDYAWLQSYENRPLYLNPIGNDVVIGTSDELPLSSRVGIKTNSPQADLDVNGSLRTRTLEVTGSFAMRGIKQIADAPDKGRLRSLAVDPTTGTLYFV